MSGAGACTSYVGCTYYFGDASGETDDETKQLAINDYGKCECGFARSDCYDNAFSESCSETLKRER